MNKFLFALVCSLAPITLGTPAKLQSLTEKQCLVANLYFEARGEGAKGMQMVGAVTINRVKSVKYPNSICAVVFQHKQFSWVSQVSYKEFSAVVDAKLQLLTHKDLQAYKQAYRISSTMLDRQDKVSDDVLWYHSVSVKPEWSLRLKRQGVVGRHVFYSE